MRRIVQALFLVFAVALPVLAGNPPIETIKIWYSDKVLEAATWQELPAGDVQGVVIYFDKRDPEGRLTRLVMRGDSYYCYNKETHAFSSSFEDSRKLGCSPATIKYGLWTSNETMARIEREIQADWERTKISLTGQLLDPVYILKVAPTTFCTGADFAREISSGTEGAGTILFGVANGATEDSCAATASGVPNNDDWETGAVTVEMNVTSADSNIEGSVRACRENLVECTAFTAEQTLGTVQVFTFTTASQNWTAGACADRLVIEYRFRSTKVHGGAAIINLETGTVDAEVTTVISENVPACPTGDSLMVIQ